MVSDLEDVMADGNTKKYLTTHLNDESEEAEGWSFSVLAMAVAIIIVALAAATAKSLFQEEEGKPEGWKGMKMGLGLQGISRYIFTFLIFSLLTPSVWVSFGFGPSLTGHG